MGQSHTHYDNLPAGEYSVLPVDGHSYSPKVLEYILLVTESSVNTELVSTQRSNLQAVYPLVAKFYRDGFTLNQLKRIPCVKFDNKTLFQVILSKLADPLHSIPSAHKWQLHVKRSFITTEHSNSTITTHVTELWRDIQEEASRGARLVSIEPTIPAAHHQIQEVDVFFDVPIQQTPSFFIYQAISVPVLWHREANPSADALECDWFSHFTTFLSEGWKLVEILFDSSVRHRVTVPSRTLTMNSVWVFEKKADHENDPSPRWEGVIIRYLHKSYTRFEDFRECHAKTSWNTVIHSMGKRGWELACIVTTPPRIVKGSLLTSINCKILMFFQRPFSGNKPLRRMSSNAQGPVVSPIRVDSSAIPEWSILGESHLEEGRPVILPPYSERGVDVGPLESTPDRGLPETFIPAEPPPTYAEAVAGDVTVLFSTSLTERTQVRTIASPTIPLVTVSTAAEEQSASQPPAAAVAEQPTSRNSNIPRNGTTTSDSSVRNQVGSVPVAPSITDDTTVRVNSSVSPPTRTTSSPHITVNSTLPPPTRTTFAPHNIVTSSVSVHSAAVSTAQIGTTPVQGTSASAVPVNIISNQPVSTAHVNHGIQQTSEHFPNSVRNHPEAPVSSRPPPKPPRSNLDPKGKPPEQLSGTLPLNSSHTGRNERKGQPASRQPQLRIHPKNGSATVGSSTPSNHKRPPQQAPPRVNTQPPIRSENQPHPRKGRDGINVGKGTDLKNLQQRGENQREKFPREEYQHSTRHPLRQVQQVPQGKYHATYRNPEGMRGRNGHGENISSEPKVSRYEKNRPVRRESSKERRDNVGVIKRLGTASEKGVATKPKDFADDWPHGVRLNTTRPTTVESGHKDLTFNPAFVQKRRDRDYEKVPGPYRDNSRQKRSKDDISFSQDRLKREPEERPRAQLADIKNQGNIPQDGNRPLSNRTDKVEQESHESNNFNTSPQTRPSEGGQNNPRNEIREATVRSIKKAETFEPGKRLPTYHQAITRRNQRNLASHQPPHSLPDLIRDKRALDSRRWVVNDLDDDEVFITSQVLPESQPQRGLHTSKMKQVKSGNGARGLPVGGSTTAMQTQPSQPILEAWLESNRFNRDTSDRRSLDSLRSFIQEEERKKPPQYEQVLAKRVVKPKPLKQRQYTGPDIIEHTANKDPSSKQDVSVPNSTKPPLPSYQQVVYSRSGARPKLRSSQSDQWSSENVMARTDAQRGLPNREKETASVQRSLNDNQNLVVHRQDNSAQRKRRPAESQQELLSPEESSAQYRTEKGSRLSVSPVGSYDSFDLISQWSQDDIEPPPSRLSQELSGRGVIDVATNPSDGVRGDYALVNEKRNRPDPSQNLQPSYRHNDRSKSPVWSMVGQMDYVLGPDHSKSSQGMNKNCSQENIFQHSSRSQSVSQRHVYIGKEIL